MDMTNREIRRRWFIAARAYLKESLHTRPRTIGGHRIATLNDYYEKVLDITPDRGKNWGRTVPTAEAVEVMMSHFTKSEKELIEKMMDMQTGGDVLSEIKNIRDGLEKELREQQQEIDRLRGVNAKQQTVIERLTRMLEKNH